MMMADSFHTSPSQKTTLTFRFSAILKEIFVLSGVSSTHFFPHKMRKNRSVGSVYVLGEQPFPEPSLWLTFAPTVSLRAAVFREPSLLHLALSTQFHMSGGSDKHVPLKSYQSDLYTARTK